MKGKTMKYVLAVLACVAICLIYVVIGTLLLGWENHGGIFPMMILMATLAATWRGITKSKTKKHGGEKNRST